jgi:ABC-type multidrug transport system fused ATPase/permease subunit
VGDYDGPMERSGGFSDLVRLRLEVLRLLRFVDRRFVVLLPLASLVAGVLPIVFALSVGLLVAEIPDVVRAGFDSEAGHRLVWILAMTTGTFAALQVFSPIWWAIGTFVRDQIDEALRAQTLDDLMAPSGIAHLEDASLQDHLTLIREGHLSREATPGGAAVWTVRLIDVYVRAIGASVLVGVAYTWWAALGLLAACLLGRRIVRRALFAFLWSIAASDELRVRRHTDYDLKLGIGPTTAMESRVFGLTGWLGDRFRSDWDSQVWKIHTTRNRLTLSFGWAYGILLIAFGVVFVLAAKDAAAGSLGLGALAILVRASFDLADLAREQPSDWELEFGTVVLPKFKALEEKAAEAARKVTTMRPLDDGPRRKIRFEGVGFRYPGNPRDILGGLELSIPVGNSIAIVGANGAGKTTLVKLLAGLYEPTEGRVVVDDADLRELLPADWRKRIAVIFQDFVRYDLPVRENVGFGAVARLDDTEALTRAASKSGVLSVIEALPHGWDTVLSRQYTRGTDLSGGEWQRVALARCHLAIEAGARVLVLDEPTASLDVRGEAEFFERFVELTQGLTTILISHRFSTVRAASRIVVLEEGRIVEDGSHEELVALGGTYAEMFRRQAGRYHDDVESEAP